MAADHDLLFGLIALQGGLIDRAQLVAAFQAWCRDRSRALADPCSTPISAPSSRRWPPGT